MEKKRNGQKNGQWLDISLQELCLSFQSRGSSIFIQNCRLYDWQFFVLGEFGTWTNYVEAFAVDIDLKLIFLDTLEFPVNLENDFRFFILKFYVCVFDGVVGILPNNMFGPQ